MPLTPQDEPQDFQQMSQADRGEVKKNRLMLERLLLTDGVKSIPDGTGKFLCPYHNDKNPSAEIRELPSGFYFICYACDIHLDYFALVSFREKIPLRDSFKQATRSMNDAASYLASVSAPQSSTVPTINTLDELVQQYMRSHPNQQLEELNRYDDPDSGSCTFATVRVQIPSQGKRMLQASFTSQNGWEFKSPQGPLPLFNRSAVRNCENVVIVEGEKCVRAFGALAIEGWTATTSPGGSKASDKADWSPLAGKNVWFWRDNDKPGKKYQDETIANLRALPVKPNVINIVDVDRLAAGVVMDEGDDIVDFLQIINNPETSVQAVIDVLTCALPWSPTMAFQEHLIDVREGRYQLVNFPNFPMLSKLTQAGLPGKSTLLTGNPGSAKSFLAMYLGWSLNENQVPCASLFLEDGKVDYQKRCVAQMAEFSDYVDGEWQEENPDEANRIFMSVKPRLDSYFEHVTCLEAKLMTPTTVLDWLNECGLKGYRVAMIDPVTAMELSSKQWMSDQNFVLTAQSIITDYGMSLIMTTHQKTGVKKATIDGAAGGQAWSRFTHTNLWLNHSQDLSPLLSRVEVQGGAQNVVPHKRGILITKARNGPGAWREVAADLDPRTLKVVEYGVILGKAEVQGVQLDESNPQF